MTIRDHLRHLVARQLSRRGLFKLGGAGVATAIIGGSQPAAAGLGAGATAPASLPGLALATGAAGLVARELLAADPHALTARSAPTIQAQVGRPAIRILPIDRAKFLAGGRFDLRLEASNVDPASAQIQITVSGLNGPEPLLVGEPVRTSSTTTSLEVTYPNLAYAGPGGYVVAASLSAAGQTAQASVNHDVVLASPSGRKARNIIFYLGDGMGQAVITGARVLSKGIVEGKYLGLLELEQLQFRGHVTTSGADSLATDSANSMSSYMTGHKASVNAMGVYEANDPDPARHPRVETMAELLKRARGMKIGIVTTAEIQDATPAAVWAHTRRRSEYLEIMNQALDPSRMPDLLMGGGMASLLPQSAAGSRRKDDRDLTQEFQALGFSYATSRAELNGALAAGATKLLGLYHLGHMNVYLDRQHFKDPTALPPGMISLPRQFPDQPNLMEMTSAALKLLGDSPNGFFLMVEGASIDKMEHPLDWPRALYDAIEFDQAVGVGKRWAAGRDDTLIVVTADHNHAMSIAGTNDRRKGSGRAANGVYGDAGFPEFFDSNGDGFPDDPDPARTLFIGWSNHPDHRGDFRFDGRFTEPAQIDRSVAENGGLIANPEKDPNAALQIGNLPYSQINCVHTCDDVSVFASGPGSQRFMGTLDNTEIFFAIADALGVDARKV